MAKHGANRRMRSAFKGGSSHNTHESLPGQGPGVGTRPRPSQDVMASFNLGQDPNTPGNNPVNAERNREKKRRQAMTSLSGSFATRSGGL